MDRAQARRLFDASAETYDQVNRSISLGLERRWRLWAAHAAMVRPGARVLDAFAGTGRVGLRMAQLGAEVTLADISPGMLAVATERAREEGLRVRTVTNDLTGPLCDLGGSFDAVTVMWGLRYLDEPSAVLRRLATVLAPAGRMVIVEFIEPRGGFITALAATYFFHALPWIAGVLAGRRELYRELVSTTHEMGPREHLLQVVREAGLDVVEEHEMGFGLVLGLVARATQRCPDGGLAEL